MPPSGHPRFSRQAAPRTRAGRGRLLLPLLRCAIARQLALRQVAQADAVARCRMLRDDATDADLDVVGMRAEDEKTNGRYVSHARRFSALREADVQLRSPP